MRSSQKSALFTDHLPLAKKMAWRFARRYGRNIHELMDEAEASLELIIAQWDRGTRQFKPGRCNPTTYIYQRLYYDMMELVTRGRDGRWKIDPATNQKQFLPTVQFSTADGEDKIPQHAATESWYERLARNVGEDARAVLNVILHAPADMVSDINARKPAQTKSAVAQYLRRQGWTPEKIELTWAEVEAAL